MSNLYFLDTEFIESGPKGPIQLVSVALVKVDFDEAVDSLFNNKKMKIHTFYAVSEEFDPDTASDWVKENVFTNLGTPKGGVKSVEQIKNEIVDFVGDDENPIFIADYCAYDWVVFCQIFGTMMELPQNFPMFCIDLKQICVQLGNPNLPEQKDTEHNALNDARHNLMSFLTLYKKYHKNKEIFGFIN